MGLNPTPITPTFPHAPRFIPDGRLSRVRLATMTIIAAFPVPRRLKRSPTFTPSSPGWLSSSMRCALTHVFRHGVLSGSALRTRHDREFLRTFEVLPLR
jgi:hypothetical protein